jgi:hypothetical protein
MSVALRFLLRVYSDANTCSTPPATGDTQHAPTNSKTLHEHSAPLHLLPCPAA